MEKKMEGGESEASHNELDVHGRVLNLDKAEEVEEALADFSKEQLVRRFLFLFWANSAAN